MKLAAAFLALLGSSDQDGLLGRWDFTPEHRKDAAFKAVAGPLDAAVAGPVAFSDEKPEALVLDGDSKAKHRVDLTDDLSKAPLPRKAITVEAWVRVDRPQEWGGIAGALQDNGSYEKGWLLGFNHSQFCFALASKNGKGLTYLKASTAFQPGCWYHVVGTYDGAEQRIYVDGRLRGQSRDQGGDIEYPPKAWYTIGAYRDDDEFYAMAGRLDRVSVFGRALGEKDVAALFAERKIRFPGIDPERVDVVDWPTHLRDNRRTGMATENLKFPLRLAWVYKARQAPQPSWPDEAKADYYHKKTRLDERVTFDRANPVVSVGDRVYFGSSADDKVTCLEAATGREVWAFFAEGPVRLAPTVAGGRVLFGSDDGFVYALSAADGTLLWKQRVGPGPRRVPGNGRMISAWPVRTDVLVEGDTGHVCAGVFPSQGVYQAAIDLKDGKVLESKTLAVTAQGYLQRVGGQLHVSTGRDPAGAFIASLQRRGKEVDAEANALSADYPHSFIGAGDARLGGGDGKVAAFGGKDAKKIWSANVEGRVHALAASQGRLFASTDKGWVYCFAPEGDGKAVVPAAAEPPPSEGADWILKQSGVMQGYALMLGADAALACAVARRTSLQVVVLEPDPEKVAASRRTIDAAGLYGRLAVHQGPLDALPYGDCLFNLVVAGARSAESLRVLRPSGGVAIFGRSESEIVRRGPLEGAGEWTGMYADPGNTACSGDRLVAGELQLQWFGKPGPRTMIDRHHRTVPPLYKDGRLFVPGEDRVTAVDAYNGTILWDLEVPHSRRVAAYRDSSYLALTADRLYVAAAEQCLALEPRTGKKERAFAVPGGAKGKVEWGWLAESGDLLLGTAVKAGSIRRDQSSQQAVEGYFDFGPLVASDALFALDKEDGRLRWSYAPKSGALINPTFALDDGAICFIESTNPETLKKPVARLPLSELVGKGAHLVSLDAASGKPRWSRPAPVEKLQHIVSLSAAGGGILVTGSRNSGTDKKKSTVLYDLFVFDAKAGELRWSKELDTKLEINGEHGEQDQHPVIVGGTVYLEPGAFSMETGEPVEWKWPWAGGKRRTGCGTLSASASGLYFRDSNVTTFDLAAGQVKKVTSETRPGCWINVLPAGGLLLAPEASSGCTCNFAIQTSLALIPKSVPPK